MLGTLSRKWELIPVVLLGCAALVMFAIAIPSGDAASFGGGGGVTATATQELEATINSQVSWGTAGGCTQNIKTNNFGNLAPSPTSATLGSFNALPEAEASTIDTAKVWVGCVTTNTTLASVAAEGTEDMTSGPNTLALSNVSIGLTNATKLNGGTAGCEIAAGQSSAGACTLAKNGPSQTLVTDAEEGTTELNWQYQLDLPANQPVGSYTGGEVTFTATAEPPSGGGAPS